MSAHRKERRIVVGVGGASGSIYARQLLDILVATTHDIAVIFSAHARRIWQDELGSDPAAVDCPQYDVHNFDVPFASGSNACDACVIIPCSMGMLGRIAHGTAEDLIARTADVCLKERRQLIVVPRETPYSRVHLENMLRLTDAGAVVLPASPSFYGRPASIEAAVDTVVARIVDHLGIPYQPHTGRWGAS
ncbi:MAG: UbiX family flavin prenyltransferase [Deltaproteobacteria bacterium]|nr:UbiX family flavin prenyltransferase [Deltaproteobacteria bacterium]